jgi:peptide/nickel transport system substrate-binding protein
VFRRFAISCLLFAFALPAAARTRPHYGGTLRIETASDPWLKPNGIARRLVFDGLTRIGVNGSVQSALATGWEADTAHLRWEFHLRPGVHFQNGSPLTAAAVVASLNLSCNGNCPWTAVNAVGSAIVFVSDSPTPNLPALLAGDDFLVAFVGPGDGSTAQSNIGTGAFQVVGSANGVVSLKANEACWQGRPFADAVEIHANRAVRDQWLDLSMGRTDLVEVPAETIRQAQQQNSAWLWRLPPSFWHCKSQTTALCRIPWCGLPLPRPSIALPSPTSSFKSKPRQLQACCPSLSPATHFSSPPTAI